MRLNEETLKAKGLSKEQIDFVLAEAQEAVREITVERDTYKNQLETAQNALQAVEGVDVNTLQNTINDLKDRLAGKDDEIAKVKSEYAFETTMKEAIRAAAGKSDKAIMALMDVNALKESKNQETDIKAALETVKKEHDYLFGSNTSVPRVVSVTSGINNDAQTKKEQANEALRSLFGKE